jgi:hypothetical protein
MLVPVVCDIHCFPGLLTPLNLPTKLATTKRKRRPSFFQWEPICSERVSQRQEKAKQRITSHVKAKENAGNQDATCIHIREREILSLMQMLSAAHESNRSAAMLPAECDASQNQCISSAGTANRRLSQKSVSHPVLCCEQGTLNTFHACQ